MEFAAWPSLLQQAQQEEPLNSQDGEGGPQGVHSSPTSLPPTEPRFLFSALMAHDILKGTNKRIAVPSF